MLLPSFLAFPSSPTALFQRCAQSSSALGCVNVAKIPWRNICPTDRVLCIPASFSLSSRLDMDFKSSVRSVWPLPPLSLSRRSWLHERSRSVSRGGRTMDGRTGETPAETTMMKANYDERRRSAVKTWLRTRSFAPLLSFSGYGGGRISRD